METPSKIKKVLENLKAVLCNPEGEVAIRGSDEDRAIIGLSLREIEELLAPDEKNVWVAWTNSDLTEGRGHKKVLVVCEIEATANRLGAGKSVQGTDCTVTCEVAIYRETGYCNGGWLCPGDIVKPSKEDELQQQKADAKDRAMSRAIDLGMSAQEIFDLQQI